MKKWISFSNDDRITRFIRVALVSSIIGIFFGSSAMADKIGINFIGGTQRRGIPAPLKSDELAGVIPQKFWNNAYKAKGRLLPVGDDEKGSSATYPGFSVSWSAFKTNARPIPPRGPVNYRLWVGYLEATANQPATVVLRNIPRQFISAGRSYSLVVYYALDNIDFKNRTSSDKVQIFTLKGAKAGQKRICGLQPSGAKRPLIGHVQVPDQSATDDGEKTPAGNYVVFSHLTDRNITLTSKGGFATDGNPQAAINAIQIVP